MMSDRRHCHKELQRIHVGRLGKESMAQKHFSVIVRTHASLLFSGIKVVHFFFFFNYKDAKESKG